MRSLLLPALLLGTSLAAHADDYSYGGFELGLTKALGTEFSNSQSGLSLEDEKHIGTIGGLYFGRAMGKWRVEGEYAIRKNWLDEIDVLNDGGLALDAGEGNAGGNVKSSALMGNAWYQLAGDDSWKLFAGLGVGLADIDINRERQGSTLIADSGKWTAAGQAMLQVIKVIPGGVELGLGVRHFRTVKTHFETAAGLSDTSFKNNEVFARLSWRFGAEAPKAKPAPMPAPAPVAEPAPAPAPKPAPVVEEQPAPLPGPFLVFFDWDKSDITPEAAEIIKAAAKAFNDGKAVRIDTTGHADRSGPDAYNRKLGLKRANAVRAALVAEGIGADLVSVQSQGESSPLVPTADGVREPQNCRAEIVISR